jgi:hypothetical protein
MVESNPESGYDDTIHVVMERTHGNSPEESHTRVVCAHRDKDAAEEEAEERNGPFKSTWTECVGLHHD